MCMMWHMTCACMCVAGVGVGNACVKYCACANTGMTRVDQNGDCGTVLN